MSRKSVFSCLMAYLVLAGAVSAQETTARSFQELRQTALQSGKVRVLVKLNLKHKSEGLLTPEQVTAQRERISQRQAQVLARLTGFQPSKVNQFRLIPYLALEVGPLALDRLAALPDLVAQIDPDPIAEPTLAQSVPLVGGPGAYSQGFSGAGWAVAVLDTGVDKTHPFLSGKVVSEACYSSGSSICPNGTSVQIGPGSGIQCSSTLDGCDHGTHVAGIVAGNNGSFNGVAKDGTIIAMQVFSRNGNTVGSYSSDQVAALERVYALRTSFNIASVNMSLGGGRYFNQADCDASNGAVKAAIDTLRTVGIATVIASGNNSYSDSMSGPGCISTAVSVGSTTKSDVVSSFSNSTAFLNLLAPGSSINSSVPGGLYTPLNGTSMATPHVAGAWAVYKQKFPAATVTEVLAALQNTGRSVTDTRNGITKKRIQLDVALGGTITGPANNNFGSAGVLTGITANTTGSNVNANKEAGEPNHVGNPGGSSVWWTWTAPAAGAVTISLAGSSYDTLLAVYAGSSVNALSSIASNDDFGDLTSQVSFNAVAGTTYRIAVDGFNGATGSINLALNQTPSAPVNDNFTGAITFSGSSATVTGSNVGATDEAGEPFHAGIFGDTSIWWQWTAPTSGTFDLTTFGSNFDTLLGVYVGNSVGGLTEVASNDDENFALDRLNSRVTFNATAGTTYRIAVDGYFGDFGNATLVLQGVGALGLGGAEFWSPAFYNTNPGAGRGTFFKDVTGDGRADAIVVNNGGIFVQPSTGSSFGATQTWSGPFYGNQGDGTYFADVTGDGRADAIVINNSGTTVRRSTGSSLGGSEFWALPFYNTDAGAGRGTFVADVTGDGKADVIVVNNAGIFVQPSTGNNFGPTQNWSGAFYGSRGTFFADVTGDGKADVLVVNDGGISVKRSTGATFSGNETWAGAYYGNVAGPAVYFADLNGDLDADAVVVNTSGNSYRLSTGTLFGANQVLSTAYFGSQGTFFVDVTGDGRADAVVVNDGGTTVRRAQ